ncbi:sensor histidine kinase [Streptomyces sparsogenes]|uniref:sensor histidine kinase n=1 Tax=Streptomyces sparsogenes TaxID=67365 RepID=UPI00114CCE29|nr:ATP-binding protein [Streptomyces sparsogenes]
MRKWSGQERARGPRLTARARLTAFYGVLFLVSGTLLVGVILFVVFASRSGGTPTKASPGGAGTPAYADPRVEAEFQRQLEAILKAEAARQGRVGDRDNPANREILTLLEGGIKAGLSRQAVAVKQEARRDLERDLVIGAAAAVGLMTLAAVGAGWVMAGRVLRPVHAMSSTARRLSERDLHERLPVIGPADEFAELAETFNDMLARLERAFAAQRLFIANASHELRGPITTQRVLVDVAATAPGASADSVELAGAVREVLERQARLVEGLFELASGDNGVRRRGPVALDAVANQVLARRRPSAGGPEVVAELGAGAVVGDRVLVEILLDNLVRNAIAHNLPDGGGWLRVRTRGKVIEVENSGPAVSPARLSELTEPFRRGARDRTGTPAGSGLGLAIVDAVVRAHDGTLTLTARGDGGLLVVITFP